MIEWLPKRTFSLNIFPLKILGSKDGAEDEVMLSPFVVGEDVKVMDGPRFISFLGLVTLKLTAGNGSGCFWLKLVVKWV